jgi:membrane-bound lytic murein transglycosylase D
VQKKMNLRQAAALAGISYTKMMQLNPGYNRPASKSGYKLILPIETLEQFSENLMHSPYREYTPPTWMHYRMKPGDTLLSVAKKFKTTSDAIRKLNHLAKVAPRRGTNLLIPQLKDATTLASNRDDEAPAQRPMQPTKKKSFGSIATRLSQRLYASSGKASAAYSLQPGDTIYMVRSNDTLDTIARRFHIPVETLRYANRLEGREVSPGKEVVIPTHPGETRMATNPQTQTREVTYIVRTGDTIATIAKRFNTSPASIRVANMIDDSSLIEGFSLIIPTTVTA